MEDFVREGALVDRQLLEVLKPKQRVVDWHDRFRLIAVQLIVGELELAELRGGGIEERSEVLNTSGIAEAEDPNAREVGARRTGV